MRKPQIVGLGLIAVLVATGAVWWQLRRQAASAEVAQVLEDAERELSRSPVDRSSLGKLRLRLLAVPGADSDPAVRRVRARVLAAMGDLSGAWELIRGPAQAVDAHPEDLRLGADIMRRLHALTGRRDDARLARSLAERHYQLTSEPASLLLAWQCAHRAMDGAEETRLRNLLLETHPASLEAELVTTWEAFFAPDGAQRVPMERLRQLENRFDRIPLELEILLIVALLQTQGGGDLGAAVDLVDELLVEHQAIVDLRYYAAVIALLRGDQEARDAHVGWLLKNAPDYPGVRDLR